MRDKKDVLVGSVTYQIYPMSPLKANKVLIQFTKLFGKTLANALLNLIKGDGEVLDKEISEIKNGTENVEAMAKAFAEFSQDVDEDKFEALIKELIKPDLVIGDGEKIANIDHHFSKYGLFHLYKVCYHVLRVNYSDFLEGVAEGLG